MKIDKNIDIFCAVLHWESLQEPVDIVVTFLFDFHTNVTVSLSGRHIMRREIDPDFWIAANYEKSMFALHPLCDLSERFFSFQRKNSL